MTDQTETNTETTETTETTDEDTTESTESTEPRNREQKYRLQLRAAESERDTLTSNVEKLQRQIIDGIIADQVGVNPAGVYAVTTTVDFLDADGNIDPAHVVQVATDTAKTLGLQMKPRTPKADPTQGVHHSAGTKATWDEFLKK
jgi:predicted component of viral defense system (DUF524 family)